MYEYSTKLDTEKPGYDGLARLNRSDPPNSRSILSLQKNGSDAETCAETICRNHAVVRADGCAVVRAETDADLRAEHRAVIRAENGTDAAHWQSQNHYKS